mmetsp:Transcript_55152/g.170836  ORF Transcript_55152/g.170836 Transcript_55152/m.170836 type:complete len:254 (-) Transcript_55152:71-832(-)
MPPGAALPALWLALALALGCTTRAAAGPDELALVQHSVEQQASRSLASRGKVDCDTMPEVCNDGLFDCQDWKFLEFQSADITAPTHGHANPHSMCTVKYLPAWYQCLKGDPIKGAHMVYELQAPAHPRPGHLGTIRSYDAGYCFAAGHCNNTKVTAKTTLQEAETMCDEIYGSAWKGINFNHVTGKKTDRVGRDNAFAQLACAMGNWHCDIIYCKEMYCDDPTWRSQYQQLSWWTPSPHWKGYIEVPTGLSGQ